MSALARTAAHALLIVAVTSGCHAAAPRSSPAPTTVPVRSARPSTRSRPGTDPLVRRRVVLGYSTARRPIVAEELGDPDSPRRVLVVGCIHGNEPAGVAVARALSTGSVPPEVDLWVVDDINPDGVVAGTRGNAHGVDLNRNFPAQWRPLGPPASPYFAGPHPLSEPESRAAASLLERLRPTLGIWYHQALDVVDTSQGPTALERRYAARTGMRLRRLTDYPGSAVGFEDAEFGPTAFVVELPAGSLTRPEVMRHVHAVLGIAAMSMTPGRSVG